MLKVGVLVSGGGTNLQAVIDGIDRGEIPAQIVSVVASKPTAYALERAANHGIEGVCIRKRDFAEPGGYERALTEHFQARGAELILTAGFNVILGPEFVAAFPNRMMNVHPSLIPSFCGKSFYGLRVHEAVLEKGVKVTGATVHFVNEETDGGPIVLQKAIDVRDDDDPETLQLRVMKECEQVIYPLAVKLFAEGKLVVEGNKVRRLS